MARVLLLLGLVLVFYIQGSVARIAPDYIKPCPGPTPECLKNTIQKVIPLFVKGVPSLGIDPIDPLRQGYVSIDLPGGFKVELFDSTVHGFGKCIVDSDTFENEEANFEFHCNLTIKGKYKAKGQILVVNIDGDGDAKIRIGNVAIKTKINFHNVTRDGVVYHEIEKYDISYTINDRVTFSLTNLFKGNPELSQMALHFINENWKVLVDKYGSKIFENIVKYIIVAIKRFFKGVPKAELFVD